MKKYKAILFDLDGTLLPMDNDEFTRGYFGLLYKTVAPLGYEKNTFVDAMWKGVASMVKNTTDKFNDARFWDVFSSLLGNQVLDHIPSFDRFYTEQFNEAKAFTQPSPLAKKSIDAANQKAEKVVLATNPFFPPVAVKARLSWAGLSENDFDHITHYSNSKRCKPNPDYYLEVAGAIGVSPSDCLMIGNNAQEDIEAAQAVGMDTYLITDCLISNGNIPDTKKGTFAELVDFLNSL